MPAYYEDQDVDNPRTFVRTAFQQPAQQLAAVKRQVAYKSNPKVCVFSFAGLVPSSTGLSAPYPLSNVKAGLGSAVLPSGAVTSTIGGGFISLIIATLGTVDASNPVEVGFYLNGSSFASLNIPTTNTWAALTFYNSGDCVEGASGFTACCVVPGTSGGSSPTFPATAGDIVADGGVTWQTVTQAYSSAGGGTSWVIPGNADDYIQVGVTSYTGSTASDLQAQAQV